MGIPKVIIQTWKTNEIKLKYQNYIDKLQTLCPDFEYLFFDNNDVVKFITNHYPEYIDCFNSFKYNIQKYDLFRLLAVYYYGGFYFDIDFELIKPLHDLCDYDCVFPKELVGNLKREADLPWVIGNYSFGASKNNQFILNCINGIVKHQDLNDIIDDIAEKYVLYTTGPVHISYTYFNSNKEFENSENSENSENYILFLETTPFIPNRFGEYGVHHMEGEWKKNTNRKKGGTELVLDRIKENVDGINNFNLVTSNESYIVKSKRNIYLFEDLPGDPMYNGLDFKNDDLMIFVSHWQKTLFLEYFKNRSILIRNYYVIENCIQPIPSKVKDNNVCKIIYHTTPHRGLGLLCDVLLKIIPFIEKENIRVHLDVYSSFKIYNREDLDKQFESLFQLIRNHPNMTYHGTVKNEEVREALQNAHIFAYPSIFQETSCMCLMEAMSAGCICVHSSLGALSETCGNFTMKYEYSNNYQEHCTAFAGTLLTAIKDFKIIDTYPQKQFADEKYGIDKVIEKWEKFVNIPKLQ